MESRAYSADRLAIGLLALMALVPLASRADDGCPAGYSKVGERTEETATEIIVHPICKPVATDPCGPGEHLIGKDGDLPYCSRKTCEQLDAQLAMDQQALRRERDNILANNAELSAWTQDNQKAEEAALKEAQRFLRDSVLDAMRELGAGKLEEVEAQFKKRAPEGETWAAKLEKVRDLRSRIARLNGLVDGLSLSQFPLNNATDAREDIQEWAKATNHEADGIAEEMRELNADPEGHAILVEAGAKFVTDGLKQALSPVLASAFDFGSFLVNYGYDATAWNLSRERILQDVENSSTNLLAVCTLSEQLKRTVRDVGVCKGHYPDPLMPAPNPANCHS